MENKTLEQLYEELAKENDELTNRYIEAEKFIMDINELGWFQRLFVLPYMATDYLKHVLKIYKF